ncbi:polymer-forming cytoskeletal protein [Hyphococcus flavus]|uniref:Polymer-forming cytoskeletal protein n=1 Tax=Hyphococcus flavus TaxID=1866326 RepID=A0AAE9ZE41_9PROT|nr:polymer-forming cytoskeletal protein [Hyphococcus flavus]WDI32000.1 polymer-forming cytoskeletal protein [Hyphococcus flavus]
MFSKAKQSKSQDSKKAQKGSLPDTPPQQQVNFQQSSSKKGSGVMKSAGVPSIISSDVILHGNINSAGEIQLDGTLEGDIKAGSLIIGDKASVKGEVICETVTVRGRVEGGIRAKSVSLASSAHIQGDILHSSLSVETGAHFEGNCRHSDDPLSESSASDFRRARPSAPTPAPRPVTSSNDDDDRSTNDTPSFLNAGRSPLR